jgi:cytochrome P450
MLLLSTILFLICIGLTIYYLFLLRQRYQYFSRRGIPTPPFRFFFGHLKTLWNATSFHRQLESWTKQYGKIYGIYQGAFPTFVVSDPDFLQEVFVKQFFAFSGRREIFAGNRIRNVFNLSGAQWRRHRHVINPTFSAAKLKMMSHLINGCISDVMDKLAYHVGNGDEFNIYLYYKRMTMDVICKYIHSHLPFLQDKGREWLRFLCNLRISFFFALELY